MSSTDATTNIILDAMAHVLSSDYEGRFKVVYEDTAQLLQALPLEPGEEIRNAFDHFATATIEAAKFQEGEFPSDDIRRLEIALAHIQQARKHITIGSYYCLEHQFRAAIERVREYVETLPASQRVLISSSSVYADELANRFRALPALPIEPAFDRAVLEAQIVQIEKEIEKLTSLIIDYYELYKAIIDKVGSVGS